MKIRKQQYITTWLAYFTLIVAATALLILVWLPGNAGGFSFFISMITWVILAAAATVLFLPASRRSLARRMSSQGSHKTTIVKKKRSVQGDEEQLDIQTVSGKIVRRTDLSEPVEKWGVGLLDLLVSEIEIMSGVIYLQGKGGVFESTATYALPHTSGPYSFKEGEGLTGQAVKNRQVTVYRNISDSTKSVFSGLGSGTPSYLCIAPLVSGDRVVAVIEVAGFRWSDSNLEQLFQLICRELSGKFDETGSFKTKRTK